jgi:hypothetical protein
MISICAKALALVYRIRLSRGGATLPLLEEYLGFGTAGLITEDDLRNEKNHFELLFGGECKNFIDRLYSETIDRMSNKSYSEAERELCLLAYLQELVSVALWKNNLKPSEALEQFAREFDRLDVESERRRLYELANSKDRFA